MEDSNDFPRYIPQYPLPEAIQEMKRDDTVCQYCGVSYLIHNEIKKLEEKLEKCEQELSLSKGWKDEKVMLQKEIDLQKSNISRIEKSLKEEKRSKEFLEELAKSKERDLQLITTKLQSVSKALQESEKKQGETRDSLIQSLHLLKSSTALHRSIKSENESLKGLVKTIPKVFRQYYLKVEDQLKVISEIHSKEVAKLKEGAAELTNSKEKMEKMLSANHNEMEKLQKDNLKNTKLSNRCSEMEIEISKYRKRINELQNREKEVNVSLESMKESLQLKEKMLLKCTESLNNERQNFEIATQDYNRQLEKNRERVEKLDASHKQKELEFHQLQKNGSHAQALLLKAEEEHKNLKAVISKLQKEVSDTKIEREQLIEAHQNRIQQLRDSYFEKLKETDAWSTRLKEELEKQQEQFKKEKTELCEELFQSHQKDIAELEEKLSLEKQTVVEEKVKLVKKLQHQLSSAEDRWLQEQKRHEELLQKEKDVSSLVIKDQVAMIEKLNEKIKGLEQEMMTQNAKEHDNSESYKKRCLDAESKLQLSSGELIKLEQELTEAKHELNMLHETIRRECEERLELTEALTQARTQLLSYMKISPLPSPRGVDSKLHTPSQATSSPARSLSPLKKSRQEKLGHGSRCFRDGDTHKGSEQESRQRIADAIEKRRSSSRMNLYEDGLN